MRESFVFHAEYINDLPEEYKSTYAMYAINYAIEEVEPSLTGLELSLWLKIKRRIDFDLGLWEKTKEARAEAGRSGGLKSGASRKAKQNEAKLQFASNDEANVSKTKQDEANEAVNVNVNDNVNESVSVYVNDVVNVNETSEDIHNKLNTLIKEYNFDLTESQQSKIITSLITSELPSSFLDYASQYVLNQYKKIDTGLFYSAVMKWDIRSSFSTKKTVKKKEKPKPLKNCPQCNSKLKWVTDFSSFCVNCRKNVVFKNGSWELVND